MSQSGYTLQVNSAYRTPEYQQHLRDIWNKWQDLKNPAVGAGTSCYSLREEVHNEMGDHGLDSLKTSPAGRNGPHTQGKAFDVGIPAGLNIDAVAAPCCVFRPPALRKKDKWHFVLKEGPCVPTP